MSESFQIARPWDENAKKRGGLGTPIGREEPEQISLQFKHYRSITYHVRPYRHLRTEPVEGTGAPDGW